MSQRAPRRRDLEGHARGGEPRRTAPSALFVQSSRRTPPGGRFRPRATGAMARVVGKFPISYLPSEKKNGPRCLPSRPYTVTRTQRAQQSPLTCSVSYSRSPHPLPRSERAATPRSLSLPAPLGRSGERRSATPLVRTLLRPADPALPVPLRPPSTRARGAARQARPPPSADAPVRLRRAFRSATIKLCISSSRVS